MSFTRSLARGFGVKSIGGASNLVNPNDVPWSLNWNAWLTGAGTSLETAVGIPALLGTLLRLGWGVGLAPQKVYEGPSPNRREAVDSWQYRLLHDKPSSEVPPAVLRGNLAVQAAGMGYGIVRKWKGSSGRVVELQVLESARVTPRRQGGRLVFEDRSDDGKTPVVRDQSDLIFVPSLSMGGGPIGVSPITAARLAVTVGLQRQRFEQSYYLNDARPGLAFTAPEPMAQPEAQAWVDAWDEAHAGVWNAHKTGVIGGGLVPSVLPISLTDAQFVDSSRWTAEQFGQIYAMPKAFLNTSVIAPTELDWRFFTTFCVGPFTTTIDQAFNNDPDLFPKGAGLKVEHLTDALLKPDIRTRYEAYKAARQAGWMTSNDVRALENMAPHEDGDVLQVVPVGGGANPENDVATAAANRDSR